MNASPARTPARSLGGGEEVREGGILRLSACISGGLLRFELSMESEDRPIGIEDGAKRPRMKDPCWRFRRGGVDKNSAGQVVANA